MSHDVSARVNLSPGTKVLVTGGAGFIGKHLVRELLKRGCKVTILDDLTTGYLTNEVEILDNFRFGNVLMASDISDACPDPDLVIHLASVVGQIPAKADPKYSYRVSTEGLQHVLQRTPMSAPVVVMSSSAVYGRRPGAVAEDQATLQDAFDYDGGVEGYAVGKLAAEELALQWRQYGRRILIVRPFNVVGPGQIGEYGMVLPRLVAQAKAGEPMTVYGNGTQTRAFTHVTDFVNVLMALIQEPSAWTAASPVFNIGNPNPSSIWDLCEEIVLAVGMAPQPKCVPYGQVFPGYVDVLERTPDLAKLDSTVCQHVWRSLREVVRDVVQG